MMSCGYDVTAQLRYPMETETSWVITLFRLGT